MVAERSIRSVVLGKICITRTHIVMNSSIHYTLDNDSVRRFSHMTNSEIKVKRMLKARDLNLEEQIVFNILNFIRTIHLNRQNFIESSFESEFFGELPMTIKKNPGQVMGLITATIDS